MKEKKNVIKGVLLLVIAVCIFICYMLIGDNTLLESVESMVPSIIPEILFESIRFLRFGSIHDK